MAGEENKANAPSDQNKSGGEELITLKSSLDSMKGELESLKVAKTDMEKKLDEADKELLSPEYLEFLESKRGGKKESKSEEVNYEEMTPAQIAKHLEAKYKGDLTGASEEVAKRIGMLEEGVSRIAAQFDLTVTSMKHPELGSALETNPSERTPDQKSLIDTMYKLSQENPNWNAEKCLRSAKLEIKAVNDEKETKEKERAEKERKSLSEKGGVSSFTVQGKQLSKEQAADVAWKSAFGNKTSVE